MHSDQEHGLVQVGAATIPSGPAAPSLARTAVSSWIEGRGDAQFRQDALVLVSELVTNSVRHAGQPDGAPVHVSAASVDGVVRVEVRDQGHGPVRPRAPDRRTGGFGLYLVEQIAARWGIDYDDGTRVWFEISTRAPGAES
jgi:anti-sigma regulatory factor (Ser/Thr protein kinase)